MAIKVYIKMPGLLPSILSRGTASTEPMYIYMGVMFYYCITNNLLREETVIQMQQYKLNKYLLLLLEFFSVFIFIFSIFNVFLLSLALLSMF